MTTRNQINSWIENYAKAVKDKNPTAVSELFALSFDHIVHGVDNNPANPWNTKKETDRKGVKKIYQEFFANAGQINVDYTDRIIDVDEKSAAMVVRVENESTAMENALFIKWNDQGKIIFFYNWYGQSLPQDTQ